MATDGFSATFLGHQSWLVSAGDTHVLVDPLLGEGFGHGGLLGRVYPPRVIDVGGLPPITAVIITHEHDDHFDPVSLAALPRHVPVYLPRRASIAAWTIVAELGFDARALEPGAALELGRLIHCSAAVGGAARGGGDEWEVSPFVLHDHDGPGCFASSVDLPVDDAMIDALAQLHPSPGLWTLANNTTHSGYEDALAVRAPDMSGDEELLADIFAARLDQLAARWAAPRMSLVCGGGWSFTGEREWMNRNHFPIDGLRLCDAVRRRQPNANMHAPMPGERFVMHDDTVTIEHAAFVHLPARDHWPARSFVGDVVRMPDYAPACGRTLLDDAALLELERALQDFAAYLYGRPVFASICALPSTLADGRQATMCLSLRNGDAHVTLAYDPSACRFVRQPCSDPVAHFASGLECWAADLLALLRGDIGPSALCFAGRMRYWNADPKRLRISPSELWRFAHPLARPRQTLALYRRLLATT